MSQSCLILISGIPATGKTTIAKYISEKFHLAVLIADRYKEIISDRISSREDPVLFDKVAKASYDVLYYSIGEILKTNSSCIAEAFFLSDLSEPKIKELKNKYNCKLLQVYLKCDFDVVRKRYSDRLEKGQRHKCHAIDMATSVNKDKIGQAKLQCCDHTIEIDTTDFANVDYDKLYLNIKQIIF